MVPTRALRPLLLGLPLLALLLGSLPAHAGEDVPEPRFGPVDYARPEAHLALSPEVGPEAQLRSLAEQLQGKTPRETLANLYQWMNRNLRFDASKAQAWRPLPQMLKERSYGGCADHAAAFGTLARAAGIPCVWVKTMDVDWIEDFRAGRPAASEYRGHVFLEVHLDGRWQLLDATAMRLYGDYDTQARILPGNRFAYDKGDDPHTLVLSCRWEPWLEQTHAYFAKLDLALVPWSRHEDLLAAWRVYVAGNRPVYGYVESTCKTLGYHVALTFNTDFERILPQARGRILIVTCDGRRPVLPEALWDAWLPPGAAAYARGGPEPEDGVLAHVLADGTRVVFATAQDYAGIQRQVAKGLRAP